ncbi:septal ring lytic transglycosylase RlpA family protein [Campylobacter sp. VicNov18]|uniref:septal ring lytic transglycosylase RlpA family protein n=1 Tax=Campylobacter bilis TaxID=2691918 RepID=UPI00130DD722|nr:septal ring lytic transglycosylase RlpA family protein [Campylobacter bilis]MPV63443.1 septal ring lytic transglycosylase RlpA family protein [Campylobacter hepaticus]MBM0636942.1 septal ring lytic transglycosylase RlpA family protein [Campylobacter bilis]MCC8277654.1 septal ring lytic transglycosylase RlpA family protein [Campylobacter bilis]MCC8299263.1 septal ring lytic transglycosylase RlpA family protein [Campylobacter bilis]MCC8300563.1 septal ring lytic transglycosylase RlpA family p
MQRKIIILKLLVVSLTGLIFGGCFSTGLFSSGKNVKVYYPSNDFKSSPSSSGSKGTMKPYTINGKTYYPTVVEVGETADGIASWYGPGFHGKKTSNGEIYDQNGLTAAHKTLPMNTILKVTNLNNNRQVTVRVNDRGPFVNNRIIDLSKGAASEIDMVASGTAPVRLEVIGFGSSKTGNIVHSNVNYGGKGEIANNGQSYEGGNFMVQIGAFKNPEGAKIIAARYKTYRIYSSTVRKTDGLNRVFLTGFRSEDEARDFAASGTFAGAFVVRE